MSSTNRSLGLTPRKRRAALAVATAISLFSGIPTSVSAGASAASPRSEDPTLAGKTVFKNGETTAASAVGPGDQLNYVLNLGTGDELTATSGVLNLDDHLAAGHSGATVPDLPAGWTNPTAAVPGADTTIGTYDLAANQPGNATGIDASGALMRPSTTSNQAVGESTLSTAVGPSIVPVIGASQDGWIPFTYYNGNGRQDVLTISHKSSVGSCFTALGALECQDLDNYPAPDSPDVSGPNNALWRVPTSQERTPLWQAGNYAFYTGLRTGISSSIYCLDLSGDIPTYCPITAADTGWDAAVTGYEVPGFLRGSWRVGDKLYAYGTDTAYTRVNWFAWDLTPALNGTGMPTYLGSETYVDTTLMWNSFRGIPWVEFPGGKLAYATSNNRMVCVEFETAPTAGSVVHDCESGGDTITRYTVPGNSTTGFVTPMVGGWTDVAADNPDPVGEPVVIGACVWANAGTMVGCYDTDMQPVPVPTLPPGTIIGAASEVTLVPHTSKLIYNLDWQDDSSLRCFDTLTGASCGSIEASPTVAGSIVRPYGSEFVTDNCLVTFGDGANFSFNSYTLDGAGNMVWTAGCPVAQSLPAADFTVEDPAGQYCSPTTDVGDWENVELSNIPVTTDSTLEFYDSADNLLGSATFSNATAGGSVTVPVPAGIDYANIQTFTTRVVWSASTTVDSPITYRVTTTWSTTDGSGPQACFQAQLTACPTAAEALNTMAITSPTVAPFAATPFTDTVGAPITGNAIGCSLNLAGHVYLDPNGLTNSTVDGTGTNSGDTLFATLIDSLGNVVGSVAVGADGSYMFTDVLANTTYTVQLSTTDETAQIGSPPSTGPSLPSGLLNVGENVGAGAGNDGTADGVLTVAVGSASVTDANFGIEEPPVAGPVSAPVALNPGGSVAVPVPALDVSDPEDGTPTTITIVTLPTNATLYYNGAAVTAGQVITNFDPTKLTVDPDDGSLTVTFTYSTTDAAGVAANVATVTMPFVAASIELVKFVEDVIDDGDGLTGAGDTVVYAFQVKNTGDSTLTDVTISDSRLGLTNVACVASLAVGATATCPTQTIELTEADVLAGGVENRATATGSPITTDGDPLVDPVTGQPATVTDTSDAGTAPDGVQVTEPGTTETPNPLGDFPNDPNNATEDPTTVIVTPAPSISLVKSSAGYDDVDDSGDVSLDDTVRYSYVVTNTGNLTINDITITDDNAVMSGGPLLSLAPGESDTATFTAVHTVDQADLDAGAIENTATVNGTATNDAPVSDVSDTGTLPNGSPLPDPEAVETPNPLDQYPNDPNDPTDDPTTVQFGTSPSISLLKWVTSIDDPDNNGPDVGDTIHYAFAVTNTGNVTLTNITVTDPTADEVLGTLASLAPLATDSSTFTATHELVAADITARGVENTATVSGNNNSVTVTDISDTATAPDGSTVADPEATETPNPLDVHPNTSDQGDDPTTWLLPTGGTLELVKSVASVTDEDNNGLDAGDTILYAFTVTNTGTTTLHEVVVTDDKIDVSGDPIATMLPGAVDRTTFTGTYVITNADIVGGGVENTATVTGLDPAGDPVTDTSDAGTAPNGALVIDPDGVETPNPLGEFDNDPQDPTEDPTTYTLVPDPRISLIKSVDNVEDVDDNGVDAGDIVHYTFTVRNEGNLPLTDVRVTDPLVEVSGGPLASLAVGASDSSTFTATYEITDADIMAGGVENTATATGTHPGGGQVTDVSDAGTSPTGSSIPDPDGTETPNPLDVGDNDPSDPTDDPTTTQITPNPAIEIIKSVASVEDIDENGVDAGDVVHYSFKVTNVGNITLTNVVVADDVAEVQGGPVATLAAGATTEAFTGTHTLTQAEVDAGGVENTATATGTIPGGQTVTDTSDAGTGVDGSPIVDPGGTETPNPIDTFPNDPDDPTDDPTTTVVQPAPAIRLVKSFDSLTDSDGNGLDEGDVITFRFVVTNTGNVTLTNVTVTDPKVTVAGGPIATLAVGATDSTTYTGTYVVTAADLEAEAVENTATATGTTPKGAEVTDTSDAGTTPDGSTVPTPDTTETPNPLDEFPNDPDDPTDDPTTVELVRTPRVQLVKSVSSVEDIDDNGVDAGDVVHYAFKVTNTGNIGLTDLVVTDPKLTVAGGPLASLAMGASDATTFTGTYTLTEDDIVAGAVENTATVEAIGTNDETVTDTSDAGTNPDGTVVTNPGEAETPNPLGEYPNDADDPTEDPTTVTVAANPRIVIVKSVASIEDIDGNGTEAGDIIHYSFAVTNAGNVTLSGVTVTDPTATVAGGPLASLSPGQTDTATFTATYTITEADVEAGMVENVATATGTDPKGTVVTSDSDTGTTPEGDTVPNPTGTETPTPGSEHPNDPDNPGDDPTLVLLQKRPEITVRKSVTEATADTIKYQITATNTGNVVLTDVTITDAKLAIEARLCAETLPVQASCSITASYAITQADRDAGRVVNTAIGTGIDPTGDPVTDDSDTGTDTDGDEIDDPDNEDTDENGDPTDDPTVIELEQEPSLSINKQALTDHFSSVGETIKFKITVTNDGNVTIADVLVVDSQASSLDCPKGNPVKTLAPKETIECTASMVTTDADVSAGKAVNTAKATGVFNEEVLTETDSGVVVHKEDGSTLSLALTGATIGALLLVTGALCGAGMLLMTANRRRRLDAE